LGKPQVSTIGVDKMTLIKSTNEKIKTGDHKFIFIFNRTELKGIKRKTAKCKIKAAKKRAVTERPG
jgi:GTP cyclohydrolase II